MEAAPAKRRKAVRRLVWGVIAVTLALALLPVWFPWVLKPLLNHYGLAYAQYERIGYARFAVVGASGDLNGTRLEVRRVECVLPMTWLWRKVVANTNPPPFLSLSGGKLFIHPPADQTEPETSGSFDSTLNEIVQTASTLQRMLPTAELTNCVIHLGSNSVVIPRADWNAGRLRVGVQLPAAAGEIELTAQLDEKSALRLAARWDAHDFSMQGQFSNAAEGWRWAGEANWLTNRAEMTAQFATNGWWPLQAKLDCRITGVPAQLIHRYGYDELSAQLTANLSSNQFKLEASGSAKPTGEFAARGLPPASFSLAADGNPKVVNVRTLNIQSPGVDAELTRPVGITWTGKPLAEPAQLKVTMDLSKLPGDWLTGQAKGVIRVRPSGPDTPAVQFYFSAENVRAQQVELRHIAIRGEYVSSALTVEEISADGADGSKFLASGGFDFAQQQIVQGRWEIAGSLLGVTFPDLKYDELAGSGQMHGPLTNLVHSGVVTVRGLQRHGLKSLNVRANWSGRNLRLDFTELEVQGSESVFSLGATMELGALRGGNTTANLTKASLRRGQEELFALAHPCNVSFTTAGTNNETGQWQLLVDAFDWEGPHCAVSVTTDLRWPAQGVVKLAMTNLVSSDFSDFLTIEIPDVSLDNFFVTAAWSNGPVRSTMVVSGALTNRAGPPLVLRGELATGDTLAIKQLSLENHYTPTFVVTGNVPVQVVPGRTDGWLAWEEAKPIALQGRWADHESQKFSFPLPTLGELVVAGPDLDFQVHGTAANPTGSLKLRATMITWPSPTNNSITPELEDFQLTAEIQSDSITLDGFSAKLDGQMIEATGVWPLKAGDWKALWSQKQVPDWTLAHGQLQVAGAQVAVLSRYLPEVLAPEGRLDATLELKPGRQWEGMLSLTNAATRPLATMTPVRDISASLRLDGNRAVLEEFNGQIGGQPISAGGYVSIADMDGSGLEYQLNLRGTNLPLARSPELLLRGDMDLSLRRDSNAPPLVSGEITLRDGLFVQNTSSLVWSGPVRPGWHPPYFSVTNEPFADWKLDLAVRGNRFLRVRTPVFSGILSANFQLNGPLHTPVLTGDARVDSGRLVFPFGSLTVDQGFASFGGNDPRGPDLQINASGRNYRYEVRLEVKGPADGANVTLSSTPPLSSEQILLMLTAGELPQTDFSFSSSARAEHLGAFLGKDLLSRYLGTDPAKERLIFRSGESISQEGRLTYSVEYKLTDRWSIIGAYDEFNAFNADLKWNVIIR